MENKNAKKIESEVLEYLNRQLLQINKEFEVKDIISGKTKILKILEVGKHDYNLIGQDEEGSRFFIVCHGDHFRNLTEAILKKIDE